MSVLVCGVLVIEEEMMGGDARRASATFREALCRAFGYLFVIVDYVVLMVLIEYGLNVLLLLSEVCVDWLMVVV